MLVLLQPVPKLAQLAEQGVAIAIGTSQCGRRADNVVDIVISVALALGAHVLPHGLEKAAVVQIQLLLPLGIVEQLADKPPVRHHRNARVRRVLEPGLELLQAHVLVICNVPPATRKSVQSDARKGRQVGQLQRERELGRITTFVFGHVAVKLGDHGPGNNGHGGLFKYDAGGLNRAGQGGADDGL